MEGRYEFPNAAFASAALKKAGCSLGRLQRDAPRGILHGEYDIQKWRNLRTDDRDALHGIMVKRFYGTGGPVVIKLYKKCPDEVRKIIAEESTGYRIIPPPERE